MIRLVEEGERHYRVLAGSLPRPPDWAKTAETWVREAAVARDEDVVMVKLTPPARAEVLDNLRHLVDYLGRVTGVTIPLDEFSG
jgi:hypothetical protein